MTVSLRVMTAGHGYAYLLRSVITGDGDLAQATALTRYYTEAGTPPGTWLGSGVAQLGNGELEAGMAVTPAQLRTFLGRGCDPVTGESLGRPYANYPAVTQRISARVTGLAATLTGPDYDAAVARVDREEHAGGPRTAVAGFDLTFSVPKSVSVLWGVADANTQGLIVEAHHAAVAQVLDLLEREVAATRVGHAGIGQVDVLGVVAAAYDHWDSRANDPQLHTHLVIANKVRTAADGRWRTLDSRALHHAVVALSEHYNAVLADRLTGTFGLGWDQRAGRAAARNPTWEITGVSDDLIAEFSRRSRAIDLVTEQAAQEYMRTHHGRRPPRVQAVRLRARATLATRPAKTIHPLSDLTRQWRERAASILGDDPTAWSRRLTLESPARPIAADDVPAGAIEHVAVRVVEIVGEKRSTWRHWNLWAEASRQTMGWRFATARDREAVVARITEAATGRSVQLTPPDLAPTPATLQRADGSSRLRPKHAAYLSSMDLLATEARLLDRAETLTAPTLSTDFIRQAGTLPRDGTRLSAEQAAALDAVATSGRQLDVLVGPAGTGKTTAMRALLLAWTAQHGAGSVVGLAPSAAAAAVLADDLGVACDNTAKWLYEHDHDRADYYAGQLVIVDESTLASTRTLDRITALAAEAGAKVLLVGDPAQLQSVDAGGAFSMLVEARGDDVPELSEVHRFTHEWERGASLALRRGAVEVVDTYAARDRVRGGTTDQMTDAAYAAWRTDLAAGRASILVTDSAESVRRLNDRARAERLLSGAPHTGREALLAGDARASVGDVVITRRNDRRLVAGRTGWVRNGDHWQVTRVGGDGATEVRRAGRHRGASVVLPPGYVAEHVDLGYAVTAHRAQGMTVDTAHVVVSTSTARESLYVAMTRGREANTAYVALDKPDDSHTTPQPDDITARTVLFGVLQHSGAELSAHHTMRAEQEKWGGIAHLAGEYDTIAAAAERDRWSALVQGALTAIGNMTDDEARNVVQSDAFGVLVAELRHAEANRHDVPSLLPRVVAERSLHDADNIAAVLAHRVAQAAREPLGVGEPDLVAGLIPNVAGPVRPDEREALDTRRDLIQVRARALAETAARSRAPWVQRTSEAPLGAADRERWISDLAVIAAYRDRYGITSRDPLGSHGGSTAQRRDAARARAALRRLRSSPGAVRSGPAAEFAPRRV